MSNIKTNKNTKKVNNNSTSTSSTKVEQLPFFVYGTLRTGQGNWSRFLKRRTVAEIPAILPQAVMYHTGLAYVLDAGKDEQEYSVKGDLMFVKPEVYELALKEIDGLEGYNPLTNTGHYVRVARKAEYTDLDTGEVKSVLAWVYFAGSSRRSFSADERVQDGDWLAHLKRERSYTYYGGGGSSSSGNKVSKSSYSDPWSDLNLKANDDYDLGDADGYFDADDNYIISGQQPTNIKKAVATEWGSGVKTPTSTSNLTNHKTVSPKAKAKAKAKKVFYFAFGSNMNEKRMKERGVSFTNRRFAGTLYGYRLSFNKSAAGDEEGFANIEPAEPESWVEGVVYETDTDQLLKLDRYEGVPAHYYHATVTVRILNKNGVFEEVAAVAYVAQPSKTKAGLKPSRDYLNHLLAGKAYLSSEYYAMLEAWEVAPERPKVAYSHTTGNRVAGTAAWWREPQADYSYGSGSGYYSGKSQTNLVEPEPQQLSLGGEFTAYSDKDAGDLLKLLEIIGLSPAQEKALVRLANELGISAIGLIRQLLKDSL